MFANMSEFLSKFMMKNEIISLKTAGMLMVSPVAAPLAPYTDTTGRAAITIQVLFKSKNIIELVLVTYHCNLLLLYRTFEVNEI